MKIRFGEFTLDLAARQLFRGASELHLSRKAFDLLVILLERRPGVVDKDTLRDKLWGATSVVDANLNNLVSEVRTVLQDDPQQPRFLRTVHRVGYAFCGAAADDRAGASALDHPTRFWLIWNDRGIPLGSPATIIGRDPESAIWIDVPGVSRRHARVTIKTGESDPKALIEDLGSTNGTFVDGKRVTGEVSLDDGQSVQIGEATLTFRTGDAIDAPTKRIGRPGRRKPAGA